eukprot:363500-Chlamydomonas_euryale.AAC.2
MLGIVQLKTSASHAYRQHPPEARAYAHASAHACAPAYVCTCACMHTRPHQPTLACTGPHAPTPGHTRPHSSPCARAGKRLARLDTLIAIAGDPDSWVTREEDTGPSLSTPQWNADGDGYGTVDFLAGDRRLLGTKGGGGVPWQLRNLRLFLQHVALMTSTDESKEREDAVRSMWDVCVAGRALELASLAFLPCSSFVHLLSDRADAVRC